MKEHARRIEGWVVELLELLNGAREELEDGDYRLLANLAWTRLSRELTDLEFERWRAEG